MTRIILLSVLAMLLCLRPVVAGPTLIFDPETHHIISQYKAGELWYPASLTKLMTAYLTFQALKNGDLRLDQSVAVSEMAASQPPSKIGLPTGSQTRLDLVIQATLVYSANDMAVVLAEAVSGSLAAFVELMNRTAAEFGMTATHFTTANGLHDPVQVTTARDIGLLVSRLLADFPDHRHFFTQAHVKFGDRQLRNRNALLRQMPEANGLKTGFTCNSGYNLVASATIDRRTLVAIVFGAPDWQTRANWAQDHLSAAFQKPRELGLIDHISNNPRDKRPPDLTEAVCLGKNLTRLSSLSSTSGWGVSLGRFASSSDARDALTSRMYAPGSPAGVLRLPGARGFLAAIWNLSAERAMELCGVEQSTWPECEVLTPGDFNKLKKAAAVEYKELKEQVARKQKKTTAGKRGAN